MSAAAQVVKHYRLFLLGAGVAVLVYGLLAHAVTVQVIGFVFILYALLGGT